MSESTVAAVGAEMKEIGKLAWPVSLTRLIIATTRIIPIFFVGRLGDSSALAATSLAFSVANVTGYFMMMSFVQGLATLAGQAFGARDYATVGYNLQMALMLSMAIGIFPISVLWLFSQYVFGLLGQEPGVSADAARFLIIIIPSVFTFAWRQVIQIWCQVQGIVRPFTVSALIAFVLSTPITFIMVKAYGFIGGAWAQTIITTVQFLMDSGYVTCSGVYKKTWVAFSLQKALLSLKPMLKLAVLSQIMLSEWWASEITVMMAGRLYPDDEDTDMNELMLSAMAVFAVTNHLCLMLLIGPSLAVGTRVARRLGAGNAVEAGISAVSGIIISATMGLLIGIVLIVARRPISATFTTDENLVELMMSLMWPLAMYQLGLGMCSALEGILIGSRRQARGAPVVVVAYFVIGVPVSYVCGYTLKLGIVGLIVGRVVGKVCQLLFYSILVIRTDWDEQVQRASTVLDAMAARKPEPTELAVSHDKSGDGTTTNGDIRAALLSPDGDGDDNSDDS